MTNGIIARDGFRHDAPGIYREKILAYLERIDLEKERSATSQAS